MHNLIGKLGLIKKRSSKEKGTFTYALGGGKGGIGKSFITSNLALYLAKKNLKTLLIDLDFGGANAHTYLRVDSNGPSAKDFLYGKVSHLGEVVAPTQFKGLSMIRGASDWDEVLNLNSKSLRQLFQSARSLGYDRVIYDLGAGTGIETVEAFLDADAKVAVSTPEPISIENTYNFLKKVFYRKLQVTSEQFEFQDTLNLILSDKEKYDIKTPYDLLNYVREHYPQNGIPFVDKVLEQHVHILVNQCRSPRDQKVGKSLAHISRQYFGQKINFLGSLDFDNRVWQSIRAMKPLFVESPEAETLKEFKAIFSKLESSLDPESLGIAA